MNVLLCPDSFKDALSAQDAAAAMARGVERAAPQAQVEICPLADGGEGSLEALIAATGAERHQLKVQDALGRPRQAAWGWLSGQRTAFIELAEASGLQHLEDDERTALHTSTFGVGELLLAALDQGAEKVLLLSALPRSARGVLIEMIAILPGIMIAAPMPCRARKAIRLSVFQASAHASDATVKIPVPICRTVRRPKRSPRAPPIRIRADRKSM